MADELGFNIYNWRLQFSVSQIGFSIHVFLFDATQVNLPTLKLPALKISLVAGNISKYSRQ